MVNCTSLENSRAQALRRFESCALRNFDIILKIWACSSAVERYSYKVDVLGPNPSMPTV